MKPAHNVVGWFEIPVHDMNRAIKFYKGVFGYEFDKMDMPGMEYHAFPYIDKAIGSGGALVKSKMARASPDGVLVFFTAFSGDCANELSKVEQAGGRVLMQKRLIKEDIGYMGIAQDTEGNRIAIHSRR
jgi:uncharacterized protein